MVLIETLASQAAFLVLVCCGVPLIASAGSGLVIAILQTATQIQEQTIQYISKLLVLMLTTYFCGAWMLQALSQFFIDAFLAMAIIGNR